MKRLGIFVFYDSEGIVSEYVEYLLAELKPVISYQIIVVNGSLRTEFEKLLLEISDKLVIRENKGFDAGAYRDIFRNYLTDCDLQEYDEVVLCNDSFYGPFFPFQKCWEMMEDKQIDFWGITRHPEGEFEDGYAFPTHIQTYFITIKKNLFLRPEFRHFWDEEIVEGTELMDVVKGFEIKFTQYFVEKGFRCAALSDVLGYGCARVGYNENPYLKYSYELISEGISPVLKRKSLLLPHNELNNALRAYAYVCEKTPYPERMIRDHVRRISRRGRVWDGWDFEKLELFNLQHENIYLYGAGHWSEILQTYYKLRGWKIAGIFVSAEENIVGSERVFKPDALQDADGMVVALGKENLHQVVEMLKKALAEGQLFIPKYT